MATKLNTVFSYSNLGLTLLGHSIEKISAMKYAEYVKKPKRIPEVWQSYVGAYKLLNDIEIEEWKTKDIKFKIEDGFFLIEQTYHSGKKSTTLINSINDTEAIVEGLGRGKQETVYVKDGVVHAQGLRFEKIKRKE